MKPIETSELLKSGKLMPLEEKLQVSKVHKKLIIGIPKEINPFENRVALVPDAINMLVHQGHEVVVEAGAGKAAYFSDTDYAEMGAKIAYDKTQVFKADIILKIAPLILDEIEMLAGNQTIISFIHASTICEEYFRKLIAKKVRAVALEYIEDQPDSFPVVRSMSEIEGNTSLLVAAEYLSSREYGKGKMLGGFSGISPTEIVVIGAGIAAEYAVKSALGMGAYVKVFDNSVYKLRKIQNNLHTHISTSIIQPRILLKALKTADIVISAYHCRTGRTPVYVTDDMVQQMKQGAVVVDLTIDKGGTFETSTETNLKNPVYVKHGVTHYCVPNITSKVAHTASYALSNVLSPILAAIGEKGGIENILVEDEGLQQGVYLYNGTSTNRFFSEKYNLPYKEISLLMAAFR